MSTNSFEKIDYSLRPAKSVERKMILSLLMALNRYQSIESYQYIGFGSIYYVDFSLFHKFLNIKKMTSIEWAENEERAKFNLPLQCVDLRLGSSHDLLPSLINNESKNITWLDYDNHLSTDIIGDIESYSAETSFDSLLMISLGVHPDNVGNTDPSEYSKFRYSKLHSRIGEENVPYYLKNLKLNKWELSIVYREVVINKINSILRKRNSMVEEKDHIIAKQVLYFHYSDNAKMMTIGFFFHKNSDSEKLEHCNLEELDFFCDNNIAYEIKVPNLTSFELSKINRELPRIEGNDISIPGISDEDIATYERIYRYFPNYKELFSI